MHPTLAEFIRRMPKAELHIHLEGSISPQTLLDLAIKNKISLPADDLAGVERMFQYKDFLGFLEVYRACARCLLHGEDFERVAYEMARDLAVQNVRYAEVMLSPAQHMQRNMDFDEILGGVAAGFERAKRETGIVCHPAFDFGRQFSLDQALRAVELAQAGMQYGVVAFSIGGDEANYPPEPFVEVFAVAKAVGLHVMAHAGEVAGANSVRGAVEMLGVDRIGHGFRVLEDPEFTTLLARRRDITFDVCPTSNIRTGVVSKIQQHPLREMFDAGLPITLNSDDPTL
ncbi:MAG: adenosine deaminase, partial [Herpetosiphon sp.]|nr:adenosine deaminase [Herpetosiphon sp.]